MQAESRKRKEYINTNRTQKGGKVSVPGGQKKSSSGGKVPAKQGRGLLNTGQSDEKVIHVTGGTQVATDRTVNRWRIKRGYCMQSEWRDCPHWTDRGIKSTIKITTNLAMHSKRHEGGMPGQDGHNQGR